MATLNIRMNKTRPRDFQRQRVYNSENALIERWDNGHFKTIHETRDWINSITSSRWFQNRFCQNGWDGSITISDGRRRRSACGSYRFRLMKLPRWSRTKLVVLHELAHVVVPDKYSAHGPEFCKTYLALIKRWDSHYMWADLKQSMKDHKVKFTAPDWKV